MISADQLSLIIISPAQFLRKFNYISLLAEGTWKAADSSRKFKCTVCPSKLKGMLSSFPWFSALIVMVSIPWVLITDPTSRVEEPVSCSVTDTRTVDVGLPSMGTLWADRPFVVSFGCGGKMLLLPIRVTTGHVRLAYQSCKAHIIEWTFNSPFYYCLHL